MYSLPITVKGQSYELRDSSHFVHGTMEVTYLLEGHLTAPDAYEPADERVVLGYIQIDHCNDALWAWGRHHRDATGWFDDIVAAVTHVVDKGNVCAHGDRSCLSEALNTADCDICGLEVSWTLGEALVTA